MKRVVWFCFVFSFSGWATTFLPIPIARQIKESDAIIQGRYISSIYKKLPSGEIVTEHAFKVNYSQGIKKSVLRSFVNFKVLSPGGEWQEESIKIYGTPKFLKDEKVVLFLAKNDQGYWIQNLSLGKYILKKIGSNEIIVSSVFPYHPQMGQISLEKFYQEVQQIKGISLVEFMPQVNDQQEDLVVASRLPANNNYGINEYEEDLKLNKEKVSRKPSQESREKNISVWWLIIILSLMGGFSSILLKKNER